MLRKLLESKLWWLGVLLIAVGFIYLGSIIPGRVDVTAEGRYTIGGPTRKLLSELKAPVQITVLLKADNLPSGFKKLAASTAAFLEDCKQYSSGKLSYQFITPAQFLADSISFPINDTAKQEWLKANAVKQNESNAGGTQAFFINPIALVSYDGAYAPVNLLQGQGNKGFLNPGATALQFEVINNAEAQMEYQFASAIAGLVRSYVPIVAYATGNGQPTGPEAYDLSTTLQAKYRFFLLNLQNEPTISDSIKTLLIVKPTVPFSDAEKLKLDQYLLRGGRLFFCIDQLNAGMDSLLANGAELTAFSRNLGLEDLLFKYGVRINNDLVQDRQSDMLPQNVGTVGGKPQIELLPWPYFPLLYSNSNHPISKNLDAVVMQFPNSIDTVRADGVFKSVLLASSNTSRIEGAPANVNVEVLKRLDQPSAYKQAGVPLAVLLEGEFKSLFANRLLPAQADSFKAMGLNFLPASNVPGKVLVTGDGDWILNGMSRQGPLPMGMNPYTQYQFANKDFLLNALEYMTDDAGIMAARSKSFTLRLLDPKKLESQKTGWQWFNIGLPLAVLVVFGGLQAWRRKRRYA